MAFDAQTAAIRARALLTESDESAGLSVPRIMAVVPTALDNYCRAAFADKAKRELLKQDFSIDISDGEKDLTAYIDGTSGKIDLKELRRTPIYSDGAKHATCCGDRLNHAYTWLGSKSQLYNDRPLGSDAYACFLEGKTLFIKGGCDDNATDTVLFTTASYPVTVDDLPAALQGDFVTFLASMLGGAANVNG